MRNTIRYRRLSLLLALATIIAIAPSTVRARNAGQAWSTVASAGELDEASASIVNYDGPYATLHPSAPQNASGFIRYRVAPVDGIFFGGCKALRVRFRDTGNGALVRAYLKRTNLDTGVTATLITFGSQIATPAVGYQTRISPCSSFNFDFVNNTYWIEAVISRFAENDVIGTPGLQAIQITTDIP